MSYNQFYGFIDATTGCCMKTRVLSKHFLKETHEVHLLKGDASKMSFYLKT